MRRASIAYLLPVLLAIEIALAVAMLREVGNVTTHRLFLSARADASATDAVERFDVEGSRVVPQVAVRDDDRIAFRVDGRWPAMLRVAVRPAGRAQFEIRWREGRVESVLARGASEEAAQIAARIPARPGVVEFVSHGALTWVDPRLVTDLRITKRALAFVLLAAAAVAGWRFAGRPRAPRAVRVAIYKWGTALGGTFVATLALEAGLRALGNYAPPPILAERHDLGEVRSDPRWEYTRRYGRRLRPRVKDVSEWRHGDIVRMGFIPTDVSDGVVHRFSFQTDAEGFRNERTLARIDVAALGDSFTDAMTIDAADSWPRLVERQTGLGVQNYGTAGFGPQQELRALTDFAVAHRPRVVVLAYFAGNDIFDAEAFDDYERSNGAIRRPDPGWPIKAVVSRADTWYLVSAAHAIRRWASSRAAVEASAAVPEKVAPPPRDIDAPAFDRGMFAIPVAGRTLRWAFMPPYLNTLRMSRQELGARRGWMLTTQAIAEMREASRQAGAEFVVMFLPTKSQIYLPIAAGALTHEALHRALRYSLPDGAIDVDAMLHNRRAQNALMESFCLAHGIGFLDVTDALETRVRRGENVYFPDESHLNETGHAIVASALASYLAR